MASKGKGIADDKGSSGKRKRGSNNDDETAQNKRNREVLRFFEDSAAEFDEDDSSDDSEFDDLENLIDDIDFDPKVKLEPGKSDPVRVFPKEEELTGDELEKMLQERYGSRSGLVRHAEDSDDSKKSVDKDFHMRSASEPTIWKVKCKVGRERHTVFCIMQKYVDLKELGTKLQIISAFSVEHIKGFIFIEAEKQSDVVEACYQLADVYYSMVIKVPVNEVSQLFVVRKRYAEVKEGTWARVKSGIYKGDIAQVVAVNNERKRATVKLIPRVDLQALAGKYGAGAVGKKTKTVPPARLMTARELEEFRPLIQYRRDRDTGKVFEFLDHLMLKEGFLYKKVPFDSLSFWDVNPSEDELHKFAPPNNGTSDNLEWLSQLYGEQKKERSVIYSKGGEKGGGKGGGKGDGNGEGTSGSNEHSGFEVHDIVMFGKRDFGMIVNMEKDESYKILKNGPEGPVMMNLGHKDSKYIPLDRKFTALDRRTKTISISDTVKIIDGPTKGRQGVVKQIYRGVIFLYDELDLDNAYFCANSVMSEKVKHTDSSSHGKDEGGPSGFEDVPSSPKSPLSPKKPWQMRESNSDDRRNDDEMFSVGQALRIKVGPLKGYLCRVVAIRRSDVTVKLDSKQKVLTVKREHLTEVRGKISSTSTSDDAGLSSAFKPFDFGTEGSNDWLQASSGSADGGGWNVGAPSLDTSAWPAIPSSGASLQAGSSGAAGPSSADNNSIKEDDGWLSKVANKNNSSWGAASNEKTAGEGGQAGAWGATTSTGNWGKSSGTGASSSWGSANLASGNDGGKEGTLGGAGAWDMGKKVTENTSSWGKQSSQEGLLDSPNKGKGMEEASGWNIKGSDGNTGSSAWGKPKASKESETWGAGANPVNLVVEKAGADAWGESKKTETWENKIASNESNKWKSTTTASQSQTGAWGQAQGQSSPAGWKNNKDDSASGGDAWAVAKDKSDLTKDGTWGNKNSSDVSGGWNISKAESQTGGWGQKKVENAKDKSGVTTDGTWGNNNSSDVSGGWNCSKAAPDSQAGGWGQKQGENAKDKSDLTKDGTWGNKNSSDVSGGWNSSKAAAESKPGGWGQKQGDNAKDKSDLTKDGTWGNKNSSDVSGGWNSSKAAPESQTGGWGQKQGENASGGWKSNSSANWGKQENTNDWGKGTDNSQGGSSWNKSGGSDSWGVSKNGDNDQGGRGFGGRRGRDGNHAGRSQFGRGRGGSFGEGSGWNKDNQDENDQGFGGRGFRGGRGRGGNDGGRDQFGRGRGSWSKDNEDGNDQGYGGGGFRGRRGSGGNNDQFGRGRESWSKENQGGSSWGSASGGNQDQGNDWGNKKDWGSDSGNNKKDWSSNSGAEGKSWGKPRETSETSSWSSQKGTDGGNQSQGGGSWVNKVDDKPKSSWGAASNDNKTAGISSSWGAQSNDKPAGNNDQKSSWGAPRNDKPDGNSNSKSSWAAPSNEKAADQKSSWGNEKVASWCAPGNDRPPSGNSDSKSSWGAPSNNMPAGLGSSWGAPGNEKGADQKSSWGAPSNEKVAEQKSSWGDEKASEQKSSWGAPSNIKASGDSSTQGGGGWGENSGPTASSGWGSASSGSGNAGSGLNEDQPKQDSTWNVDRNDGEKKKANNWG